MHRLLDAILGLAVGTIITGTLWLGLSHTAASPTSDIACEWWAWVRTRQVQTYVAQPGGERTAFVVWNTDARDAVLRSVTVEQLLRGLPALQAYGAAGTDWTTYFCGK